MSYNLPRSNNSDRIKTVFNQDTFNQQRNFNDSNTNTFIQNGGNIIENKVSRTLSNRNIYKN